MNECNQVFWHGSPSGDLRGGKTGLHLGTCLAATQALEATIGRPVKGSWDGTREYGKTLLMGWNEFHRRKEVPTGYNADAPDENHYPSGRADYSDQTKIPLTVKPRVSPYKLVGCMTNSPRNPHEDWRANGYMRAQLRKGTARCGYYYRNIAEDEGSISIVVPSAAHLEELPGIANLRRLCCRQ
jgi:hypothetical protein